MKESISNFWLLSIVLVFILIFAAYLTVTLNYSKAFKLKNEVLTIIEKKKGITDNGYTDAVESRLKAGTTVYVPSSAQGVINAFLEASGYNTKGSCRGLSGKWYGVTELVYGKSKGNVTYKVETVKSSGKYYYCFSKKLRSKSCTSGTNFSAGTNLSKSKNSSYFYEVLLFYKLDLPVMGDLFVFDVQGTTMDIYNISDQRAGSCV